MSDEPALLAAILAHPDEDTPRLIYADWLDENGQPDRAEFIRIQCAPDAREAAKERARELEKRNREEWLAGLPRFPREKLELHVRDWEFRRGFPEYLAVSVGRLLEHYADCASVPWLRTLSLLYVGSQNLQNFANRPWNPQWVELVVQGPISIRGVPPDYTSWLRILTNCSQTTQLHRLWFSGLFDFTEEGVELLATSPYLENLRQLRLYGDDDDPQFEPLRVRFKARLVIDWDHPR